MAHEHDSPSRHEHDERWTAVDKYALHHLHSEDSPHYKALNYALDLSNNEGLENIAVSTLQGKFLALQCGLLGVKHALEVGTLGGYSAIWMASLNPNIKITTVEIDPKHKKVAEKAVSHAGFSDRIEVLLGSGVDVRCLFSLIHIDRPSAHRQTEVPPSRNDTDSLLSLAHDQTGSW